MIPPGPVPTMVAGSMPFSRAARRAMGEIRGQLTSAPLAATGVAGTVAGAGAAGVLGAGAADDAAAAPAVISPRGWPTVKVSPLGIAIEVRVPADGAGTSRSTLSVDTSTTICSAATASPTATRHSTTTPSVTDSMSGRTIGTTAPGSWSPAASSAAGAAGAAAPLPPGGPSSASRAPTSMVSPAPATIRVTTPAAGAGTSTSTLSVVTSRSVCPISTESPSATLHSTTMPSVTDSPSSGSSTWVVWEEVVDTPSS